MHGDPQLPPDFTHLPYANPDAPKGGRLAHGQVGTFDSLNPLIVIGTAPRGLVDQSWGNNVWEGLLTRNRDEPFSLYGLLAESVETPEDRAFVEFTLRPEARWSDGAPVVPEDVIFTMELLREKGRPNYREYYKKIGRIEKVGERGIRFTFKNRNDRELPLLLGLMPILPKHATDAATFDRTSLKFPIGSGPYVVANVQAGARLVLKRNPDYWARNLPVKRGFDNFDEIRIEYFRDTAGFVEAFRKGVFDVIVENDSTRWATGYDFPAVKDGRVTLDKFATQTPRGMNALIFNTRQPVFQDTRVREALTFFLDFEWMNRNLYYDLYRRTGSFFQGSELSALGQPAGERERALLEPFAAAVRPDVMDGTYQPPVSDGSGRDRNNFRKGLALLKEAGFERRGDRLVNSATGQPLAFEMLVQSPDQERLAVAFQRSLRVIGIDMSIRQVDSAQYERRRTSFDYDMIQFFYPASLSPGNEQGFRWSSVQAGMPGSLNLAGVSSEAVDAMVAALLAADTREELVAATRALDRVLISGHYVLPLFHAPEDWYARWTRIQRPAKGSLYGAEPTTWWSAQ